MGMYIAHDRPKHSTNSVWLLRVLIVALVATSWYALSALQKTDQLYADLSKTLSDEPVVAKTVDLDGSKLVVPTYDLFRDGGLWALTSREHLLKNKDAYQLVGSPVAHGDKDLPMKVEKRIVEPLKALMAAAEADGETMMLSSAHRSFEEQQATYDKYVAESGEAAAKQYVLPVGASEHHTGLAVDFSSVSTACELDSYDCSLSASAGAWLAENAHKYGFILRYPDGARDITGVGYEPWHYRYVGPVMAKFAYESDLLTYDELVQTIAPGYASR